MDETLPTPLYHQIFVILREKIQAGTLKDSDLLPGEKELSRRLGVSRITVKRALNELAKQGYVSRHRGRGTIVSYRTPSPLVRGSMEGLLENLLMMGLETQVELLEFAYVEAPEAIADLLDLAHGSLVQRAVRVRHLDDEPLSHLVTHVPEDVGRTFESQDLMKGPMLALLERAGFDATSAEQTISSVSADPITARSLKVDVGAALMQITRIVHDQTGRPIQHIVGLYRPDRYRYEMKLTRVESGGEKLWNTAG